MADNLESVKTLATTYRRGASACRAKEALEQADRQDATADVLEAVVGELENLRKMTLPVPESYGDLSA